MILDFTLQGVDSLISLFGGASLASFIISAIWNISDVYLDWDFWIVIRDYSLWG
jgi:hypothetical protein